MIPEDRRLVIEVSETVHAGPATLIFVTPSEDPAEAEELPESARRAARTRWQEIRAELARDPRPFRQLSPEERRDRLHRLQGPSTLWNTAGKLKAVWKKVSLADCFALALAIEKSGTLVTSDHHEFEPLLQAQACTIRFIR